MADECEEHTDAISAELNHSAAVAVMHVLTVEYIYYLMNRSSLVGKRQYSVRGGVIRERKRGRCRKAERERE